MTVMRALNIQMRSEAGLQSRSDRQSSRGLGISGKRTQKTDFTAVTSCGSAVLKPATLDSADEALAPPMAWLEPGNAASLSDIQAQKEEVTSPPMTAPLLISGCSDRVCSHCWGGSRRANAADPLRRTAPPVVAA